VIVAFLLTSCHSKETFPTRIDEQEVARKHFFESYAEDDVISRDPIAVLDAFLAAHPAWSSSSAHVYWNQEGWAHLKQKDYMVSSIQVWCCDCLSLAPHAASNRKQAPAGCMLLLCFSISSWSRAVALPTTRRFYFSCALDSWTR